MIFDPITDDRVISDDHQLNNLKKSFFMKLPNLTKSYYFCNAKAIKKLAKRKMHDSKS